MKRFCVSGAVLVVVLGASGVGAIASEQSSPSRMVVVPHVLYDGMLVAYQRLHRAGLRVSIPAGIQLVIGFPLSALHITPAPGQEVTRGSVVTVRLGCPCGAGGNAVPAKQPTYRVPSFRGRRASAASNWIRGKTLALVTHLGPLRAATAPELFQNYRVTRQSPAAGAKLSFEGKQGLVTPLTVWGQQHG